jgi:CHAT domain-containing protein/Tfp pilus assembly protein PilF
MSEKKKADSYLNRGFREYEKGNYESAERYYKKALEISKKIGYKHSEADAYLSFGEIESERDNYDGALRYFKKALKIYKEIGSKKGEADVYLNTGFFVEYRKGDYEEALKYYEKALKIYKKIRDKRNEADAYLSFGEIESERDNYDGALRYFKKALKIYKEIGSKKGEADVYLNTGFFVEYRKGDYEEALKYYEKALKIYKKIRDKRNEADAYLSFGEIESDKGNYNDALKYFNKALRKSKNFPEVLYNSYYGIGKVYKSKNDFESAIENFEKSINIIEKIRELQIKEETKTKILEKAIFVYDEMIDTLISLNRYEEALEYLERTKSRNLVEKLQKTIVYPKNVPDKIKKEYEKFRVELREIEDKFPKARADEFGKLKEIEENYNKIITEISKYDPEFIYKVKTQKIKFEEIEELIDDNKTAIIEFFITHKKSAVFIVKKDYLEVEIIEDFNSENVYKLVEKWNKNYKNEKFPKIMDEVLFELYNKIFFRINKKLEGIEKIKIVPNRNLFLFPLHSTYYKENGKRRYLVEDYKISYIPSCNLLKIIKEREKKESGKNLIYKFNPGDIHFSNVEYENTMNILNAEGYENATKKDVDNSISNAKICYFICHGIFNPLSPMYSHLLLRDGNLYLHHIFNMDLRNCDTVILSSCETSRVNLNIADEFIGFPSGFLSSGANTVIGSLWEVDDFSTTVLMEKFLENFIKKGKNKIDSLREAQLWMLKADREEKLNKAKEILKEDRIKISKRFATSEDIEKEDIDKFIEKSSHPYFWAPFVLYGLG